MGHTENENNISNFERPCTHDSIGAAHRRNMEADERLVCGHERKSAGVHWKWNKDAHDRLVQQVPAANYSCD